MNRKIKYLILLLVIVVLTPSCSKWLEVKPQNGLIREDYWKTKEQLKAAVIGCYSSLLDNDLVTKLFVWGELRADMVVTTLHSSTDAINMAQGNILATNSYTDWSPVYRTINYCNTVIDFGPQVLENDNTLSKKKLNEYLSEAHALRGLMYFYLLRTFGEVPLQLEATASDEEVKQLEKSSKEEVYHQIIKDLKFAQKHAVDSYDEFVKNKGRITKPTVFAMEADAYLWENKYDSCIAACDSIIDSRRYGLVDGSNQESWFNTLYYKGNSVESIFEFQFDEQKLNPFYNLFITSNRQFKAGSDVIQDFYGMDQTSQQQDIRGNAGSLNSASGMIWKFSGTNSGTDPDIELIARTADESYAHWFVYRYPDILLMKAEALAWTKRGQEALDLVNMVRERAHALDITKQNPSPSSAEGVSEYILAERAREFAFEGKRWFDVLRMAKRNDYAHIDLLLKVATKNVPKNMLNGVKSKYKDVRSHYLPINQNELQTDHQLVQNPFYQ